MKPKELKEVREALVLEVDDFARALNVSQNSVERWEAGENKPVGIQKVIYQAFQVVIAQVSPERAREIGDQLALGLGGLLANLLLQSVRLAEEAKAAGAFRARESEPPPESAPEPVKTKRKRTA